MKYLLALLGIALSVVAVAAAGPRIEQAIYCEPRAPFFLYENPPAYECMGCHRQDLLRIWTEESLNLHQKEWEEMGCEPKEQRRHWDWEDKGIK